MIPQNVNIDSLTIIEKMQLINGISLEAARVLKKLFPDVPAIDRLIEIKLQGL